LRQTFDPEHSEEVKEEPKLHIDEIRTIRKYDRKRREAAPDESGMIEN